jgi:hypothetical protein
VISFDERFTAQMGEPPVERFEVAGVRLDDLLPRLDGRVDFMKIDVEGSEPLVLRGARELIASNPQLNIVMEWSRGQIEHAGFDPRAFLEELASLGLRTFDLSEKLPKPFSADDLLNTEYVPGILLKR